MGSSWLVIKADLMPCRSRMVGSCGLPAAPSYEPGQMVVVAKDGRRRRRAFNFGNHIQQSYNEHRPKI